MVESKHFTAGIVPLRFSSDIPEILLLLKRKHHVYGLPKGHKEPEETDIQTACRELREEAGCSPVLFLGQSGWTDDAIQAKPLPLFPRTKTNLAGKSKNRETKYFVATVAETGTIEDMGEIEGLEWLPLTLETAERLKGRPEHDFFLRHILPLAQLQRP
jgi:8-oxo-dGTP pyrophosphatase MutT (NUDIX family)